MQKEKLTDGMLCCLFHIVMSFHRLASIRHLRLRAADIRRVPTRFDRTRHENRWPMQLRRRVQIYCGTSDDFSQ